MLEDEETLTLTLMHPTDHRSLMRAVPVPLPRLSVSRKDREVLLDQRKAEYKNARLLSVSAAFAARE